MTTTTTAVRLHVDQLMDTDLDVLLDRYFFGREEVCKGYCDYEIQYGSQARYRCSICHASVERTLMQRLFDPCAPHKRAIPRYTLDRLMFAEVEDAIRKGNRAMQSCYALHLCAANKRSLPTALWILFGASARQRAIAALQVVEVIDPQGYILKNGYEENT